MAWTYGGDPSANNKDAVRFLIGDVDQTDDLIQDEEINWLLVQSPNIYIAAANACDAIAASFARQLARRSQDLNPENEDKLRHYRSLAMRYRHTAATRNATPFAGGISIADKDTREDDTDRVLPKFTKDLQEIPLNDVRNLNQD